MTAITAPVNGVGAPLKNVGLFLTALERAQSRPQHLPGITVFFGPPGFGKSFAAARAATVHDALYVEAKSTWSRKALLSAIVKEMGFVGGRTLAELCDQVSEQLALSGRPLIIDEMDHVVDRGAVEVVRDIYEGSGAAIVLIGEERLPGKLAKWERLHSRIMFWLAAQEADLEDAQALAAHYCPEIPIADDLLQQLVDMAFGSVRRICVNLELIRQEAFRHDWERVDRKTWGDRQLYTGQAPAARQWSAAPRAGRRG